MLGIVNWIAVALFVISLPYWIPAAVIALRMRIFTRVNGEEGLAIPGELVDASLFKQVYSHSAADGRSRGAALSDLFWYWLSPGPEIHQEHLEPRGEIRRDRADHAADTRSVEEGGRRSYRALHSSHDRLARDPGGKAGKVARPDD